MLKIEFKDIKVGESFVFGGKVMKKGEPIIKNGVTFNVLARNGAGWMFEDTDVVMTVRKQEILT